MFEAPVLDATLAGCACFIGWVVRRYDLLDREPWYAIAFVMVAGAVMIFVAGRVQGRIILAGADHWPDVLGSGFYSVLAGATEELGKLGAVALVAVCFRRHFNDPIDGLIYGSFAGLGAALEESVWLRGSDPGASGIPWQEPVRLAGHLVMWGASGGGGLARLWGRPHRERWRSRLASGPRSPCTWRGTSRRSRPSACGLRPAGLRPGPPGSR